MIGNLLGETGSFEVFVIVSDSVCSVSEIFWGVHV